LVALVIALITLLVLFIAALGEGLADGNRQYVANLDAHLVVFLEKSDFIMVTHDLRMCKYVDRVLQMRDGKLVRVIEDRKEIEKLAKGE